MYLKFSSLLYKIAFKLKQKSIYFELKHYIKNNENYFMRIREWDRGIGKTYSLLKLAHKFKCPIAVPNHRYGDNLRRNYKDMFNEELQLIVCNNSSIGKRRKLILCEEGLSEEQVNEILRPMSKLLIGYQSQSYYGNVHNFKREYECEWIK